MREEICVYNKEHTLLGVLTTPDDIVRDDGLPAVIVLNCDLMHRVGPNRIYVKVARALATIGFTVLRLDLAGIGDSGPRAENMPMEQSVLADVRDAMDTLTRTCGTRRFIMIGHCAGGMLSLLAVEQEPRVAGAILINLLGGEDLVGLDRQRKEATYYANFYGRGALTNGSRWRRLLSGKADYRTIFRNVFKYVISNFFSILLFRIRSALRWPAVNRGETGAEASPQPSPRDRLRAILDTASERSTEMLFIHDAGSTGLTFFRSLASNELNRLFSAGIAREVVIPESDHLFTILASQHHLIEVIQTWAEERIMQPQLEQGSGVKFYSASDN